MSQFRLGITSFAICWLRAYDFGLDKEALEQIIDKIAACPLVKEVRQVRDEDEVDEVDNLMFDIRYQERSNLVRIRMLNCDLIQQNLGDEQVISSPLLVNLLLDIGSGFGVINLTLPLVNPESTATFTIEEIVFLTRQWLLTKDESGKAVRLNIRLPGTDQVRPLYIREIMNIYYLQLHKVLWEAAKPARRWPIDGVDDLRDWITVSYEADPKGCEAFRKLYLAGFTRSLFPTSFGPVLDVWGIKDITPAQFDSDRFIIDYSDEISWFFTDGQRTTLGEKPQNQRQAKNLALYVLPNHTLYINQNLKALAGERIRARTARYGCLDVEIVRILEILTLHSAILRAYDRILDQQLEEVSLLTAKDQQTVIQITEQRRLISRSMRSLDYFNLFHTAYWEPLFARLLDNPHLRIHEATDLIEMKIARLDEEIQHAVIIQDRERQQQQREQELDVLRGLHRLSMANDIQNNVLMIINFIVSATATFAFIEVIEPLITRLTRSEPSFRQAYPLGWIILNVGIFLFVAVILSKVSSYLIKSKNWAIELDGLIDIPYNEEQLEKYLSEKKNLDYFYRNMDNYSGYLRIKIPDGSLFFEFDQHKFNRFILFVQGAIDFDPEQLKRAYVDEVKRHFQEKGSLTKPVEK